MGSDREFVYMYIRTQNKGLCIVTHIFNLENGYPRNNPSLFLFSPLGKTVGFHFHAFSPLLRTIYLTPVPNTGCIMEQKCSIFFVYE